MDLSTLKSEAEWSWAIRCISAFEVDVSALDLFPTLVAIGPQALRRLGELGRAWSGPVTIVSRAAWQLAGAGQTIGSSGGRMASPELPFLDALSINVAAMDTALISLRSHRR